MEIKFANGTVLPIMMCYNHGQRYIAAQTRNTRDFQMADGVIGLDALKALLADPANLATIEVVGDDGEPEVLENFVFPAEIKDKMNGEVWFTVGEKTAIEIENEEAKAAIDELLIALEV